MTLEDLFAVLAALPRVSDRDLADMASAADRRLMDEIHGCVFCGNRAECVFFVKPSDLVGRARWLDMCAPRYMALMELAIANTGITDDVVIRRYEAWTASQT